MKKLVLITVLSSLSYLTYGQNLTVETAKELPTSPNEMNTFFAKAYNSGKIENLMKLYVPNGKLVNMKGETLVGIDKIREDLTGLLKLGGTMQSINAYAIEYDNIALLRADWSINTKNEKGEPLQIKGSSTEVVKRQNNGTWLYIIDHPFGANAKN
jgi:ketosteroid isomerase-like protein